VTPSPRILRAMRFLLPLLALLLAVCTGGAWAQSPSGLKIDITTRGDKLIPVAMPLPVAEERFRLFADTVQEVVGADLRRTGAFGLLPAAGLPAAPEGLSQTPTLFTEWKARGADALVASSLVGLPDGRVEMRFRLLDTKTSQDLGGLVIASASTSLDARRTAHRVADYIYEKLTGEPGFFATRLAYVRSEGGQQVLMISDSDGENAQPALRSSQPIISLTWSPDGTRLAYVSFETGKPVVYVHELATGRRSVVANHKGSNSAPAWSPDGRQLAVVLTRDGSSQVYLANPDGSDLRRLTRGSSINTEPSFSADGQSVYFTSDRGGSPQVYRASVSGSDAPQRITFEGGFNARPVVSPDGKHLAYIARRNGSFVVAMRSLADGTEWLVSAGPKDDSPSFAPSSQWVIFSSRINGRDALSAASVDGKVRTRISLDTGGIRSPAWGRLPQ